MSTANASGNGNGYGRGFDWRRWLAEQGPQTVLLVALAVGTFMYLLIPMRDDMKANNSMLTTSITAANEKHANAALVHAQAAVTYAQASRDSADHMRDTNNILREIRDDQRRGAWNEPKRNKPDGT